MENISSSVNPDIVHEQIINRSYFQNDLPSEMIFTNPVVDKLVAEGHKNLLDYISWLGLARDPNLVILSPSHHYYYDDEDLKEVTTVLNLEQLNRIKQVKDFLRTVNLMLSHKSFFVGYFIDRKNQFGIFPSVDTSRLQPAGALEKLENGITSRIPLLNLVYNFIDSKTNRNLTKKSVTILLEDASLNVLDMREYDELTCFCSQKIRTHAGYE